MWKDLVATLLMFAGFVAVALSLTSAFSNEVDLRCIYLFIVGASILKFSYFITNCNVTDDQHKEVIKKFESLESKLDTMRGEMNKR